MRNSTVHFCTLLKLKYVYFLESPKTELQKTIVFKAVFPPKHPTSTIAQTKRIPLVKLVRMKAKTEQYFDSFKGIIRKSKKAF